MTTVGVVLSSCVMSVGRDYSGCAVEFLCDGDVRRA